MYGCEETSHVTAVGGNKHDYLAMYLDYSKKEKLIIDMIYYIHNMLQDFSVKVKPQLATP